MQDFSKGFYRFQKIELTNFKNVGYGKVSFSNYGKGKVYDGENSITGIYGQNGSGKTALIDAIDLYKTMVTGRSVSVRLPSCIKAGENYMQVEVELYVELEQKKYLINYGFAFQMGEDDRVRLYKETLKARIYKEKAWEKEELLFSYDADDDEYMFRPIKRYQRYAKQDRIDDYAALSSGRDSSKGYDEEKSKIMVTSFLFYSKAMEVFCRENDELAEVLQIMKFHARYYMSVIAEKHTAMIYLDASMFPLMISLKHEKDRVAGNIAVDLTKFNILPKDVFEIISEIIEKTNIVLMSLVPDLQIKIQNEGTRLLKDGTDGIGFEVTSIHKERRIPLYNESAGIKKLISICANLISCYNNPSYCLVIDEFDAGIYEYLLGELIKVLKRDAEGQLIFTSHNLRPLEVLENESLIYTVTNENQRYCRDNSIKPTQNKRKSYLRKVGESRYAKEAVYQATDSEEISYALRKAGK